MSEGPKIPVRIAPTRKVAEEWALVLAAEGVSSSLRRSRQGFLLEVRAEFAERADAVLAAYERENPPEPRESEEPAGSAHLLTGLGVAIALLGFFFLTGPRNPAVRWFERGSADAEAILHGEIWRTVTALTLHSNFLHVGLNAITMALFLGAACRLLGSGLGCALVLLAGAGGNLLNALFYGSFHVSVGASTSVFGAVGVLGGLGVARRRRKGVRGRRAWLPIAAGFALLAMLGTSGERVDHWAHLFGLLAGAVLGIPVAFATLRQPVPRLQWILGGAALAVIVVCWAVALS